MNNAFGGPDMQWVVGPSGLEPDSVLYTHNVAGLSHHQTLGYFDNGSAVPHPVLCLGSSQEKNQRHDPNDHLTKDINRVPWRWKQEQPARSQHEEKCHPQQYAGNNIIGMARRPPFGNSE